MNKYLYLIAFLLLSCKTKQDKVLTQETDNDNSKIIIKKDYKNLNDEEILISLTLKYKLYKNSYVKDRIFLIKNNDKLLNQITDYMFYDENNNPIYDIEKRSSSNQDLIFNIIFRDIPISKKHLNNKNIKIIDQMNIRDSIVDTYINFKKKNPLLFNDLNKVGDTIIVRSFSKDELLGEKRTKINW